MSEYRAKVELLILIKFISNPLLRVPISTEANRARPATANIASFKVADFDHEFLPNGATEVGKAVGR